MAAYEVSISTRGEEHKLRRTLHAFAALFQGLVELYKDGNAGTDERAFDIYNRVVDVHSTVIEALSSSGDPPASVALQEALAEVFQSSNYVCSDHMRYFLWDSSQAVSPTASGGGAEHVSYADFLLQAFDLQSQYVARAGSFFKDFYVQKGESVIWRFQVGQGYDIGFCVLFCPTTIDTQVLEALNKVCSQKAPIVVAKQKEGDDAAAAAAAAAAGEQASGDSEPNIEVVREYMRCKTTAAAAGGHAHTQGVFTAPESGYVRLFWDNRYSVLTGKNLQYVGASVTPEAVEAALRAADMMTNMQSQPRSQVYEKIVRSPELVTVRVSGPIAIQVEAAVTDHSAPGEDEEEEDLVLAPRAKPAPSDASNQQLSHPSLAARSSWWVSSGVNLAVDALNYLGTTPSSVQNYTTQLLGVIAARYAPLSKKSGTSASSRESADQKTEGGGDAESREQKAAEDSNSSQSAGDTDLTNMLVIAKRIDELEDMLAETTALKDRLIASNERHANTIDSMSADRAQLEDALSAANSDRQRLTAELRATTTSVEQLQSTVNELTSELESVKSQNARMGRELESLRVEKHLWTSARTGIQDELMVACERVDKEREAHEQTRNELQAARHEADQLRARVVQLEREAALLAEQREQLDTIQTRAEADRTQLLAVQAQLTDYERMLKDTRAEAAELSAQNRVLEAEFRTYKKKTDSEVALLQTETNEARMIQTAMQRKVEKLRAEKKVLVSELRALKDMGVYTGRLSGDPARQRSPSVASDISEDSPDVVKLPKSSRAATATAGPDKELNELLIALRRCKDKLATVRTMLQSDPSNATLLSLQTELDAKCARIHARLAEINQSIPENSSLQPDEV